MPEKCDVPVLIGRPQPHSQASTRTNSFS